MLLRFEASNHRSILKPVELSMIAVDQDRPATRGFGSLAERVLTVAGIYGPNASGKSNVLEALAWLSRAVRTSLRAWDEDIPRQPFKFGKGPTTPSAYEVDVVVNGVRYTYGLEVNDREVLFEALYAYPERRRRTLFERDGLELHLRRGLSSLSGTRELLTPTTLALSAATRFNEPEVRPVGQFLRDMRFIRSRRRHRLGRGSPTVRIFRNQSIAVSGDTSDPELAAQRATGLALLRLADVGIDDVTVTEGTDELQIRLLRTAANQQQAFDLDIEESEGTRTWFTVIGPSVEALETGGSVLLDEIDSSLHPRLTARLIELFQDPETNPRGAQLIFTSHDTSLLTHLNRDEVWLTEKSGDRSTTLTALAEFGGDRVRRSLNLERAYLQGRFGAVPDVDQAFVRQAIGLSVGDI